MTDTPLPLDIGPQVTPGAPLSPGARRTIAQHAALANGRHPANGLPISDPDNGTTCGNCAHIVPNRRNTKTFWKCPHHALGMSHSEASDIRLGWPGCPRWQQQEDDPQP